MMWLDNYAWLKRMQPAVVFSLGFEGLECSRRLIPRGKIHNIRAGLPSNQSTPGPVPYIIRPFSHSTRSCGWSKLTPSTCSCTARGWSGSMDTAHDHTSHLGALTRIQTLSYNTVSLIPRL